LEIDPSARAELLASVPTFADLDAGTLRSLATELDEQRLADGDVLMRQGEQGEALYFVTSGELEVAVTGSSGRPVIVDSLRVGAVIGEMALLAGNRRSATVTARGPASVARFSRAAFDRLAENRPGLRERVIASITPRLERVQLAAVLEQWFGVGGDDDQAIHNLQEATDWLRVPAGGTLYRPGDEADGMYIVVSGRLHVRPSEEEGTLGYTVGRGESIGELGVLGGGRRSQTVEAVRDSHLLHVPAAVVEAYPAVMGRIARTAVARLTTPLRPDHHGNGLSTLALVPAHRAAPVREVVALLEPVLRGSGQTLVLDEASVSNAFGGSLPERGSALDASLTHWLNELEAENDYLILLGDAGDSAWAERCRRQADVVLLVAAAGAPPSEGVVPAPPGAQLVLLQPAGTERPIQTAAWLERTGATEVHHVRAGDGYGAPRLFRRLTGRAVGLVFSGGGARGYAHIGLLRAIEELGIEIDMVAGTSMGALIAGAYALSNSQEFVERGAVMFGDRKRLIDRTLPVVALTKSHGVTQTFMSIFGDVRIEDLWMPFVCVSANLFEAVPVEHRSGLVWEAVRASTAIPGIFTPFVKDGALLVDGAVMNAFPVDLMRELVGEGTVIASSTMAKSPPRDGYDFGPSVSGWEALAQYLRPRKRRRRYPTMVKTLMEATSVGSKHQSTTTRTIADLVIELPVKDFGKLEFHRHEELVELGYQHALAALRQWLADGALAAPG